MTDAQKDSLTELKDQAAALLEGYNEDTATQAMKTLKEHYDEAVELLENSKATSAAAEELITELTSLIANATQS
jgi:ABC-type transporter Mla subunit MlaD